MEMGLYFQLDTYLQYHCFPLDGANFTLMFPISLHIWVTVVNECLVNS